MRRARRFSSQLKALKSWSCDQGAPRGFTGEEQFTTEVYTRGARDVVKTGDRTVYFIIYSMTQIIPIGTYI